MKKVLIDYMKRGAFDELYTPRYAVEPIINNMYFICNEHVKTTIWCPFDTAESNIVKALREYSNVTVIHSHISEGKDFFNYEPEHYDIIISNPPYSIKDEILERCYELGKPFALLLPITALEGTNRGSMFSKYGIDLLILDKRVDFNGKGKCWFNTSWFCWRTPVSGICFAKINKK